MLVPSEDALQAGTNQLFYAACCIAPLLHRHQEYRGPKMRSRSCAGCC